MASCRKTSSKNYSKRPGTSGIHGHLYETKLLSLIYFRALHNSNIQDFHLATNVDKLGSFDDICFRVTVEEIDKPLTVFIQAKHRENNTVLTVNSKSDLIKYFNSYLEIRNKFKPNNEDVLFEGAFNESECLFVIYTTAKGDISAPIRRNSMARILYDLIGTQAPGSNLKPLDDSKQAELHQILLEIETSMLARLMAKCIHGEFKDVQILNLEDVVLRYHVILAQQVFDVSDEQNRGLRDACFRQDFFDFNEEIVQLFKEKLCTEILNKQKFISDINSPLRSFFNYCGIVDNVNEYDEIKHLITYKNRKFEFIDKKGSASYQPFLDKINESQETTRRTLQMAIKQCLPSQTFKVPAWFGNKDLTIRGGDKRIERKLIDLTSRIVGLIDNSRIYKSNIVIIDESLEEGFLQLNGGIASAVGNLLVFDDVSKLLKFNDNPDSLGKLAKKLFYHLNCKIKNFYDYKFDVRVKTFPKLSFDADEYTKNIVREFSNKLLFYTSQVKEAEVETMLVNEIKMKLYHRDDISNRHINSNTIFLKYHDVIQKWWMKNEGEYLTKDCSIYENAEKHVLSQPLTSCINMMQRINSKNYTFTEDVVNSIKLSDQPSGTIILTNNIRLTVAKLVNQLIKKECVVLDMQYILSLLNSIEKIQTELIDLNKENTLILACDKAIFGSYSSENKFSVFTEYLKNENIIIILNDQDSIENVKKYFTFKFTVIKDEQNNLIDMSEESQKSILETNVIFQGVKINLGLLLDDKSLGLVGERVLHKLMNNDTCVIGKPVRRLNDNERIYIERSVKRLKVATNDRKVEESEIKSISTLHDLKDDVILVIGDPGMGKSTLLTQLSLKTKKMEPKDWILRINLLEYAKQFFTWQDNNTDIDTLKSLEFLCQAALSDESIKKNDINITIEDLDGTVSLKECDGDEWTEFELKIFLHYYNTKQLIILFDGFDEICPTYAREAFSLIKTVMNLPQKHKVWIASRSYDKIITELSLQFLFKIEPLSIEKQDLYLSRFWKKKNLLNKLRRQSVQNNLIEFVNFMSKSDDLHLLEKKSHLPPVTRQENGYTSISDKPMLAVYLSLYKYSMPRLKHLRCKEPAWQFSGLVATPLHLNMLAEHLYNQIDVKNDNNDYKGNIEAGETSAKRAKHGELPLTWNTLEASEQFDIDVDMVNNLHNQIDVNTVKNDHKYNIEEGETSVKRAKHGESQNTLEMWEKWDMDVDMVEDVEWNMDRSVFANIEENKNHEYNEAVEETHINHVYINHSPIKWDLDVNLFEIYKRFLEYKLKIRFQEKNQIDMYRPDNREQYKRALTDTKDKLIKLAAYVVYNKRLLDKHELKSCEQIIDKLKLGEENTDIICNVVNDIPIFIHSTFAEYYAVEYICQLIERQQNLDNIYNFLLNVMFFKLNRNILVILDAKIKVDKNLTYIIENNSEIIFKILLEQGNVTKKKHGCIKSSLCEAIRLNLKNLACLLLSTCENCLFESNLIDFIEIVKETNMLMIAVKMEFNELLIRLIKIVKLNCKSVELNALFENIEIFNKNKDLTGESSSDLVQKLHANVWTRMDIDPDWENLQELGGQIYFI